MKVKGYWFYGLSGVGKSYASKYLKKKIKKGIIIDGDIVRKLISTDLSYSINDRKIQLKRVLGIAHIVIKSSNIPIISTAYFDKITLNKTKKIGIKVIKITSDMKSIVRNHPTYKKKENIVGFDIKLKKMKTQMIINKKDLTFVNQLKKII